MKSNFPFNSRYGFAACYFLSLVLAWFAFRLVLFGEFKPAEWSWGTLVSLLLSGFQRDVFVALVETLPLLLWFWVIPEPRFAARGHRNLVMTLIFAACYVQVFLLFVEFFFFDEFKSRFNTVAVDYLLYPREVFVNIWESYHVGVILVICLAVALAWLWGASRLFAAMWERSYSRRARLLYFGAATGLAGLLAVTFNLKAAHVGDDRTLNEIANNGAISFVAAALTRNLEYAAFYKTLPRAEAYQRTRRLFSEPNVQFLDQESTRRRVAGNPARPRLNVVIFLEESLGSEFWGCLGRPGESLTPEMDRLAVQEGLLFTNLYASGNRTVRGMEGVLSSFPPLPGDSIVKRDRSDNVETLARVLKRDGYATLFLYGGRGLFDGMRSFALCNGYDRFIEEKHIQHPTFRTIWGVCDEDLFQRAVTEFTELEQRGQPFCATVLSVSNHKPYTYPRNRIPENPDEKKRDYAVKYSDFALSQFFRAAKKESFWTNTIFAVVADHGARVYGKQSIPIHSYEIPLVVMGPAVVSSPSRIGELGGSLDVAPTLLGLLGRPYDTLFFGRDLLKPRPAQARAVLNHNRDIGMLRGDRLVVLGLRQTAEFYAGNPKREEMGLLTRPTESDLELEKDAIALYQVADDLYTHEQYRLDGEAPGSPASGLSLSNGPSRGKSPLNSAATR